MARRIRTATLTAAAVATSLFPLLSGTSAQAAPEAAAELQAPVVRIRTFAGKCLDVANGSTADSVPIVQFRCHGGSNQKFQFVGRQIRTFAGKCLDVANGSRADSVRIVQFRCHGGPNQNFRFFVGRIRTFADKCLDVANGSRADSVPIVQFRCHGGPNQRFVIF